MEGKNSSQTKARLIVTAVFAIGFAAGALALNLYEHFTKPGGPGGPHGSRVEYLFKKIDDSVGLSAEQQKQVRAILDDADRKYGEIRKEMSPVMKPWATKFDAVRQETRERVREVLNDKQLPRFEDLVKEQDAMREQEKEKQHRN